MEPKFHGINPETEPVKTSYPTFYPGTYSIPMQTGRIKPIQFGPQIKPARLLTPNVKRSADVCH